MAICDSVFLLIVACVLHSVRRHCHFHDQLKKCLALVQEKIVSREGLDRGYGASILGQGWPDDGNRRQIRAEEFTRLWQDQVGLEHLTTGSLVFGGELCVMLIGWVIEVWKSQTSFGIGQPSRTSQGLSDRIAPLIMPKPK